MIYINYIIVSLREGCIIVQINEIVFKQLNEFKNWLWKVSQHNGAVPKPHISSTYSVATHSHAHLIISGWTTSSPDAYWGEPPHPACQPRRAVQPPSASEAASVVRRPALAPLLGCTHASSQQLPSPWMRGQPSAAQQPFRRHLVFRGRGIHSLIWVSPPLSEPKKGSRQVVSRRCGLCLDGGKRKKKGRTTNWVVTKDANNLLGFLLIDHAKKKKKKNKKRKTQTHTQKKLSTWNENQSLVHMRLCGLIFVRSFSRYYFSSYKYKSTYKQYDFSHSFSGPLLNLTLYF